MFSFCLVLYQSGDVLTRMLDSLSPHLTSGDEIIFFDNAVESNDHTIVDSFRTNTFAKVVYMGSDNNVGFAKACNYLADYAKNDRLIFLNPDTTTVTFCRDRHHSHQVIGPQLFDISGERQCGSGRSRTIWDEFKMRWLRKFEFHTASDEISYVSGAALSIDRCIFQELGGFDEKFFMYYEDIDLCLRAKQNGMSVRIDDDWKVLHVGGSSAKKIKFESELRSLRSAELFYKKWDQPWWKYRCLYTIDAIARVALNLLKCDVNGIQISYKLLKAVQKGVHE